MPAIPQEVRDRVSDFKLQYGSKVDGDNEFLIFLIAELQVRVDKLHDKLENNT